MRTSDYIKALEQRISETETLLDRLRLKAEIAREVAVEMDAESAIAQPRPVVEAMQMPGDYHDLLASDAIMTFLTDHGQSSRRTILDTLERQIKTASDKPRNIVRNCLSQLAKRGRVEIDSEGNVSPITHDG